MSRRRATASPDPYELSYVDYDEVATSGSTRTFAGVSFGAAAPSREVFVLIRARGSSLTVSSVTIGGVAATIEGSYFSSSTSVIICAHAEVPTGTTGDVVATLSGSASEAVCAVYRVTGRDTPGAIATDANTNSTGFAGSVSVSYSTPADGFTLGMGGFPNSFVSWSPFTADRNFALTDNSVAASYNRIGLSAASGSSTLDWSGTSAGAGAAWSFD